MLLTGGLYAYFPTAMKDASAASLAILGALAISLLFTMAVIARIFWVSARSAARSRVMRGK